MVACNYSVISVIGRKADGELEIGTSSNESPASGHGTIVSDISLVELEKFNDRINELINETLKQASHSMLTKD